MIYQLTSDLEEELYGALSHEANSFQRFEKVMGTVGLYSYMSLLESGLLIELGTGCSPLVALHFEMEKSRGHLLSARILPNELLMLHFYSSNGDFVSPDMARLARHRLDVYWSEKTQYKYEFNQLKKKIII